MLQFLCSCQALVWLSRFRVKEMRKNEEFGCGEINCPSVVFSELGLEMSVYN